MCIDFVLMPYMIFLEILRYAADYGALELEPVGMCRLALSIWAAVTTR